MITRPLAQLSRASIAIQRPIVAVPIRHFSTTKPQAAKNRIFTPYVPFPSFQPPSNLPSVRREDDFRSYLSLSTSSRRPLLTFWTASYCSTCKAVSPLLTSLLESGVGEEEGGVSYCEIEYDCPDIMESGLGMTYMITSMPTLMTFDRGEAMTRTKVVDPKLMKDQEWLKEWIRTEARRRGNGGSGDGFGSSGGLFGGLFGVGKR